MNKEEEKMVAKYINKAIWKGVEIERNNQNNVEQFWDDIAVAPRGIMDNMKRSKGWVERVEGLEQGSDK